MANNLEALNGGTLYVVYDIRTNKIVLETESKEKARSTIINEANLDYSTYPPFTYARDKKDIADLYETTCLEY